MKRKIFSALMFGALFVASTAITSCKDYDDDISDLRQEIVANATDLKGLVDEKFSNVDKEIAALNSQAKALEEAYKKADEALQKAIENATNDAKGYADIQAAQAQTAAIAAAKAMVDEAVENLQAGIDAANAKIKEQGETISSLLEADKELTIAVNKAQARADEAYTLAEQAKKQADANSEELKNLKADLEKVTENLKTIEETLLGQINTLGEKVNEVIATAAKNASEIEAQAAALAELKEANQKAHEALAATDAELRGLIEVNQKKIEVLETGVAEAKEAAVTAEANAKAYTDAEVAKVKVALEEKIADALNEANTNIETAKTELTNLINGKYNELDTKIDKVNEEITALIKKQVNLLQEQIYDVNQAIDAMNQAIDAMKGDISTINSDIEAINSDIEAIYGRLERMDGLLSNLQTNLSTLDEKLDGKVTEIYTKISEVESDYKAADEALDTKISQLKVKISLMDEQIYDLNQAINAINSKLATLINDNVNNLITSIIYQDRESYNVYAEVTGNWSGDNIIKKDGKDFVIFPYEKAKGRLDMLKGTYNVQEWAGYIYATINPSDIDASKADIQLENSLGKENPNYKLQKAEPAKNHLITRATSENGFWKIPVISKNTNVTNDPGFPGGDKALYALYTSYEQDTLDAEGDIKKVTKKVYSHYAVNLNPIGAGRVSDYQLTIKGCGETCTKETSRIEYNDLSGDIALGTSDVRVYKKYVECTAISQNGRDMGAKAVKEFNDANPTVLQTVLAADNEGKGDTISLTCPEQFTNYVITLTYYVWNYDGSIRIKTADIMFNKVLWGDDTTVFTVTPENGNSMVSISKEFPEFPFVKGEKSVNKTTWSEEAYSVVAVVEDGSEDMNTARVNFLDKNMTNIETVVVGNPKRDLTVGQKKLATIKNMQLDVNPGNLDPDKEYKVVVSFYNSVGALINNVIIKYTMKVPTGFPNPWHIEAAFDATDKLTIAWASYENGSAVYNYSGSFYNVNLGFTAESPYVFELTNPEDYQAGVPQGKYHNLHPFVMPQPTNYQMVVPCEALNGEADKEHVYDMTAGIKFFGLNNLVSSHADGGWADNYQIKFLSPIRYSILGTKGHIEGKTYEGMTNKPIQVNYRGSVDLKNELFKAKDPKEAANTPVYFFENRDSRVADMKIDFAATNSNNALFMKPDGTKGIVENTNGTWTLKTSDMVSMTHDTPVKFKMTVTDVWGAVTTYTFDVTVVANQ